jgi:hypothetical protein
MKYGPADILGNALKITGVYTTTASFNATISSTAARSIWTLGTSTNLAAATPPGQVLTIVIDGTGASKPDNRTRVRGTIRGSTQRMIYLSGMPGTIFADGTFEFRNVTPGRHTIATLTNPPSTPALAAVVIVGNEDLNDVTVENIAAVPLNPKTLAVPGPAAGRPSGSVPLASVRGRVRDVETGDPVTGGTVFVVGDTWTSSPLGPDGSFHFPRLLPGNYELEVQGLGYPTFRRAIVVEEEDLNLELKAG